VALVVAETFELARYAAKLVRVEYAAEAHETNLREKWNHARTPKPREYLDPPTSRGDFRAAFAKAPVQVEAEYAGPAEHHNPMEPFATTVVWDGGKLTVYDKTQGAPNIQGYAAEFSVCATTKCVFFRRLSAVPLEPACDRSIRSFLRSWRRSSSSVRSESRSRANRCSHLADAKLIGIPYICLITTPL